MIKILTVLCCICFLGVSIYVFFAKSEPFYEEEISSEIVTLFEAVSCANEYIERQQDISNPEIILINMQASKDDGKGKIDITYEHTGIIAKRFKISVDTKKHIIIGGSGNTRLHKSTLGISKWKIDSDEIVKIAEEALRERIEELDYSYVRISSMIGTSAYSMNTQLLVSFLDENGFVDDSNIYVDAISGEVEVS